MQIKLPNDPFAEIVFRKALGGKLPPRLVRWQRNDQAKRRRAARRTADLERRYELVCRALHEPPQFMA